MTPTTQRIPAPDPLAAERLSNSENPKVCPHCGSDSTRESSTRRAMDLLPRNIGKIAYRCRSCRGRFYVPNQNDAPASDSHPSRRRKRPSRTWESLWKRPSMRRNLNEITIGGLSIAAFAIFLYILARSGVAF